MTQRVFTPMHKMVGLFFVVILGLILPLTSAQFSSIDCFTARATPNCSNPCVSNCVCVANSLDNTDPTCCTNAWDSICVTIAFQSLCSRYEVCPSLFTVDETLFVQNENQTSTGVVSGNYLNLSDTAILQFADDFEIPQGEAWQITSVQFGGFFLPSSARDLIVSWTIQFFGAGTVPTGGGGPGALIAEFSEVSATGPNNDDSPFFALPTSVELQPGVYWISVFANQNSAGFPNTPSWVWGLLNLTNFGSPHTTRDVEGRLNLGLANVWILSDIGEPTLLDHQLWLFGRRVEPTQTGGSSVNVGIVVGPVVGGVVLLCCVCIVVVAGVVWWRRRNDDDLPLRSSSSQYRSPNNVEMSVHSTATTGTAATKLSSSNFEIPFKEIQFKDKVGEGAYGFVYRAIWRKTECAVKQLKDDAILNNPQELEQFRKEAELMGTLKHPNVIQTLGVVTNPKHPLCIITEFFSVGSLYTLLATHTPDQVDPDLKHHVALGIATGMVYLHSVGLVHRDLAARNILLTEDYRAKITDFGLSRTLSADQEENKTKSDVGPLKWMAPESISQRTFSKKSDVWMYGVVIYEILSHQLPYYDKDPLQTGFEVASGKLHLRDYVANFTRQGVLGVLLNCMMKCVAFEPENRPHFEEIVDFLNK